MKITEFMSTYRCKGYGNLKHKLIENIVAMQKNGGNKMPQNMVELLYRLPVVKLKQLYRKGENTITVSDIQGGLY